MEERGEDCAEEMNTFSWGPWASWGHRLRSVDSGWAGWGRGIAALGGNFFGGIGGVMELARRLP